MSDREKRFPPIVEELQNAIQHLTHGLPRLRMLLSEFDTALETELARLQERGSLASVVRDVQQQMDALEQAGFSSRSMRRFDQRVFGLLVEPLSEAGANAKQIILDQLEHGADRLDSTAGLDQSIEAHAGFTAHFRRALGAAENVDKASEAWHGEEMEKSTVTDDGRETDDVTQAANVLSRLDERELATVLGALGEERLRLVLRTAVELPAVTEMLERDNPGLGTAVKQMLAEGAASLTRDELRKLQTFAANRLKEEGFDQRVKDRAIAEDIFPPASKLFPDHITSPSDVDADSLTELFRGKAEDQTANIEPLSEDQLRAIKDLSQAWRKHFWHVKYRDKPANLTPAGEDGLKFRTPGRKPESMGTNKFWPKLDFSPDDT